jgi:hypothetical protein
MTSLRSLTHQLLGTTQTEEEAATTTPAIESSGAVGALLARLTGRK